MKLLSLHDVSVSYDGTKNALNNVSFDIYSDDFIGIIGPKRMNYSKVISVMKYISKKLNEQEGQDDKKRNKK